MDSSSSDQLIDQKTIITVIVALGITIILTVAVITTFVKAKNHPGKIILPGGITYVGMREGNTNNQVTIPTENTDSVYTAEASVPWVTYKGTLYPYSFSYPKTLKLVTFDNDAGDPVAIDWNNGDPRGRILLSVIDITKESGLKEYVGKPKKELVQNWWRQFGGLTGISSFTAFTNKNGMVGYRAKFVNKEGQSPNTDVFFEVAGKPNLLVRVANGILDPTLFDKIVDSVNWGK